MDVLNVLTGLIFAEVLLMRSSIWESGPARKERSAPKRVMYCGH